MDGSSAERCALKHEPDPSMKAPLEFRIHGMDCADEVAILRREIVPLVGSPDRLGFDILRGKMLIASGTPVITADQIVRAVGRTGMRAEAWQEVRPGAAETGFWQRRGRTILTALSGTFLISGFMAHVADAGLRAALGSEGVGLAAEVPTLALILYVAGIVAGGWFIAPRAWMSVRRLRPDMNLLMTIAVFGAAAIGEWFEAAVVTFLFALSLALESWSIGRARRAVEALLSIAPPTAHVLDADGTSREINAADVKVGDRALVKPGERIPVDGAVRRGLSHVNQAPITGESLPVEKGEGSEVFAGTINGDGALEIAVTRLAGETALAQIIKMVGEAQTRRAPSEQWVDRFAQVYTPALLPQS
jgi:Cd2+/Zn2+-exporting ATPase